MDKVLDLLVFHRLRFQQLGLVDEWAMEAEDLFACKGSGNLNEVSLGGYRTLMDNQERHTGPFTIPGIDPGGSWDPQIALEFSEIRLTNIVLKVLLKSTSYHPLIKEITSQIPTFREFRLGSHLQRF